MAAQEALILTASVRDDFTATLRKLQSQLQNLAADQGPAKLKKEYSALTSEVKSAAQSVSTSFIPALRSGNVVGLGFGAALGGVAVGLRNFAAEIKSVSRIAGELKTPVANVERIFLQAEVAVGMSTGQMQRDLESFTANMRNLRFDKQTQARLITEFGEVGRGIVNIVDQDLVKVAPKFSELFAKVGKAIQGMKDPVRQRELAKALFDDEEMARYWVEKVDPVVQNQLDKFAGAADKNAANAERFNAAWKLMGIAATNLKNEAFGPLLEVTSDLMLKFQQPIGDRMEELIANLRRDVPPLVEAMESFGNSSFFTALKKLDEATSSNLLGKKVQELREGVSNAIKGAVGLGPAPGAAAPPAPTTSQSVEKLNRYFGELDEALHPKAGGAAPSPSAAEVVPLPPRRPRGIGAENVPLPPPRPRGLGLVTGARVEDRQIKASEDVSRKTEDQTKATESANRRSDALAHSLERSRSAMDRLRETWLEFVNKLSPDAVVGMGNASAGLMSTGAGALSTSGIAGGLGGIGPAGRGDAGLPAGPGGAGAPLGPIPKGLLDNIARAEGTAGRGDYNATLGYGKYAKPSKPLTEMSLQEAFVFGRQIKAVHGSSSAIGRYQIVGNTMREAAQGLGLDWNTTKFDQATQDKMAHWIARRQGVGAWEGFKQHPAERLAAVRALSGNDVSGGMTSTPMGMGGSPHVAAGPATREEIAANLPGLQKVMALTRGAGLEIRSDLRHGRGTSLHDHARALDIRARTTEEVDAAMDKLREAYGKAGLKEKEHYDFLDEVRRPSRRASGPHLHVSLKPSAYEQLEGRPGALLNKAGGGGDGGSPSSKIDARGVVNLNLSRNLGSVNVQSDTSGLFKDIQVHSRPATPPTNGPTYDALNRASAGF